MFITIKENDTGILVIDKMNNFFPPHFVDVIFDIYFGCFDDVYIYIYVDVTRMTRLGLGHGR